MKRHPARSLVAAGAIGIALATAAVAQTTAPRPHDQMPPGVIPEKFKGRPDDTTGSTNNLSDKLRESDGVIKPPATGGGGVIRPPETGTTPVIPPPGSPGSRSPSADPK